MVYYSYVTFIISYDYEKIVSMIYIDRSCNRITYHKCVGSNVNTKTV